MTLEITPSLVRRRIPATTEQEAGRKGYATEFKTSERTFRRVV
eukprot:CAMPEP_0172535580 /NCGR_PEP_ID=MMETSP1067-20121228/7524_1 /TAXON_ID=265564 ORGANISM="Thalassiosira punctigera, Strain Tpunct2005C2" /NCGR_SAMPLE_ID=MMETSP1067 /ASSEMBLY_ACC=CAM_ASM_000444 /LENGTH=42 /DNA_ID= /DNA_START= /DNA_END= /DNA_ORIENTATION=